MFETQRLMIITFPTVLTISQRELTEAQYKPIAASIGATLVVMDGGVTVQVISGTPARPVPVPNGL
jgi:hypothetical protein